MRKTQFLSLTHTNTHHPIPYTDNHSHTMSPFNVVMVDCSNNDAGGNDQEFFLPFDVVADDSDHYFLNKNELPNGGDCFTNTSSKVYKRIMKDREILKKNLPENITVRVYEHRVDLFRAVFVGDAGTACHDGLFFFDFAFPSDYPSRPPKISFLLFSPKERTVSVTIPNSSWMWYPSTSTVLQVLVKLQNQLPEWVFTAESGRVLSEKPLVLKQSVMTNNEDVFVASCQRMLFLVQNPPKNFEGFVAEHFRKHGNVVLKACKAYKNGDVRVGNYNEDEEYDGPSPTNKSVIKVSDAFKASMETLYPQLFTAFMEDGASAKNFVKQIELDTKTVSPDPLAGQVIEKVKHGIIKKIIGTMKKILGLNN